MIETKNAPALRLRFAADPSEPGLISGYASVFGNVDDYGTVVAPGAFSRSLAKHKSDKTKPLMLWHHRPDQPIGSWLEFSEDKVGLFGKGKINGETSWGKDAQGAIAAGDIDGLSIGFVVVRARPDGILTILEELDLVEVSVVSRPANAKARLTHKRDLEELLVRSGLSRGAAVRVVAGGWSALSSNIEPKPEDAVTSMVAAINASTLRIRKA